MCSDSNGMAVHATHSAFTQIEGNQENITQYHYNIYLYPDQSYIWYDYAIFAMSIGVVSVLILWFAYNIMSTL